jgi:hypothetical protein
MRAWLIKFERIERQEYRASLDALNMPLNCRHRKRGSMRISVGQPEWLAAELWVIVTLI